MPYDATDFVATARMLDRDPMTLTTARERMEYLRDYLRELPEGRFNMGTFSEGLVDGEQRLGLPASVVRHDCGTSACIAGWCQAVFTDTRSADGSDASMVLLNLSFDQSTRLFYANEVGDDDKTYWDATPAMAARVLTHLLETSTPGTTDGVVDWSVA